MTDTALALPDEQAFKSDIEAINRFQNIVHANLRENQDYGVIPGTSKPTLLKPGAEKITKLLGLCDYYDILDRQEDWNKPFFRYLVKCQLRAASSGVIVSEGLGECNSMESRYRWRWVWPKDLPDGFDKESAVKRTVNSRNGKVTQYRTPNDDIFSQVNTLVKMAKKRALVDAALSAGRLSNVFTQDVEDIQDQVKADVEVESSSEPTPQGNTLTEEETKWLKESLEELNWADVSKHIRAHYKNARGGKIKELVESLTLEQQQEFFKEIETRLDIQQAGEPAH